MQKRLFAVGPRAVQSSAPTLRRRLLSLDQIRLTTQHCSHGFASISSVSTRTWVSAIAQQPLPTGLQLKSSLGKCYVVDKVLSERHAAGRIWYVYRATHHGKQFILKDIITGDFDYVISLHKHVEHSPHRHILVCPHLEKGLLRINIAALSSAAKKAMIRDALASLADLHDKNIIHTNIKSTNIMMDSFKQSNGDLGWCNVQVTDLDAAVILPPKAKGLADRLSENHFWRSPEAWVRGTQNTPSDVYSFAIVNQAESILRRHLSFFASEMEDFEGFIVYHGEDGNPPRLPFGRWQQVEPKFMDLISTVTCMGPSRRITAREALQHPWVAQD
ncbi:kinase-like protein [Parathielavia appendiculata]|uniref:non-specific serine/threonine protein kinase n=1 Tax=Parathielavia appendiculata TaxID=2587402 RepID=A0AAN6TZF7_9PEZI|nr:kinase-like protein [Parathielavia appendiculata]